MVVRPSRPARIVVHGALFAALAALAACGSGGSEASAGDGTSGESTAAASKEGPDGGKEAPAEPELTVRPGRTCPAVDKRALAEALEVPPASVEVFRDLEPGEVYEPAAGMPEETAEAWGCLLGSSTQDRSVQLSLVVWEEQDVDDLGAALETTTSYFTGKGAACEDLPADQWGPDGVGTLCSKPQSGPADARVPGQSHAEYGGLFGAVRVGCGISTFPKPNDPTLAQATQEICGDALAALSSPAG